MSCQAGNDPEIAAMNDSDNRDTTDTTGMPDSSDIRDTTAVRYLALGDSYTIGQSVAVADRWPVQLADTLRGLGYHAEEPQIIARTGWTTGELAAAIKSAAPDSTFSLVSLLIGVNNQYRGLSSEEYRLELRALLEQSISFAGNDTGRVFVLSIPDWGVTPFAKDRNRQQIAKEINEFNAIKREESLRAGVTYIDITDISRRAADDASLIASDGLHPSGKMYREWVIRALPYIERMLNE